MNKNPFEITKAVDFSDDQINSYFVDLPGQGLLRLAKPQSTMPMLIMGGKGSGKTHLMRFFSYASQKLRHRNDLIAGLQRDGYIGVYLRCGGFNAARFGGKGQEIDVWDSVFSYYMELWLGQLLLAAVHDAVAGSVAIEERLPGLAQECVALLDGLDGIRVSSLQDVIQLFHRLQRELDLSVNNAALTRRLDVVIRATAGQICFGLPRLLRNGIPELGAITFVYLLDEYENLMERQQRYCNTLLREKELPCSFKIGGRTYGFKTYATFSDQEEIKEGSEYEKLSLDSRMRNTAAGEYESFAMRLCVNRLQHAGAALAKTMDEVKAESFLQRAFADADSEKSKEASFADISRKYSGRERPYFDKLRRKLQDGLRVNAAPGLHQPSDVDRVIENLRLPSSPLLEKLNIYSLYRFWRTTTDLIATSEQIAAEARAYVDGEKKGEYGRRLEKRRDDLEAQLLRDVDGKQSYTGFNTFVQMSEGLPRNLLVTLKSIFNWAAFRGEEPFETGQISSVSQREGVREASDWFFDDARMPGDEGTSIRAAIKRIAHLFREIRYSDKPSEKSVTTFSVNLSDCSVAAQRVLVAAEKWSLLVRVEEGQRDKNTLRVDEKFYVNAMLAPKWDLPVARGGALSLPSSEANAIFNPAEAERFEGFAQQRISAMTAPLFGKKSRSGVAIVEQTHLGLGQDDEL